MTKWTCPGTIQIQTRGGNQSMKSSSRYCVLLVLAALFTQAHAESAAKQKQVDKGAAQNTDQNKANEKEKADPLGRSTPHGAVFGFLQEAQNGHYKEATQYLQLSKNERATKGEQIAHQLQALMDSAFVGRVGTISERPEGSMQVGISKDRERIGVFRINGTETNVDLVRVTNPLDGEIWLFPSALLANVPDLFDQIENSKMESRLPTFLRTDRVLSTPLWRLLAFLLMIPVSYVLAVGVVKLLGGGLRIWRQWKHHPVIEDVHNSLSAPATLILTIVFHQVGVYLLGIPLLIRVYYQRLIGVILIACLAWLIFRLVNRWGERERVRSLNGSGYSSGSIVLLGQRILNVLVVVVAGLVILSILGFDISTVVAGLGIGSIAIAFAAQKTLENLFGGISILGDQVIRVGDSCQIGDKEGVVEDISLRSTRIRTPDRTELSVPNGQLANMNVENLSRRDKRLFQTKLRLRQETSPDQLRSLMTELRKLLHRHPKVDPNVARVRLVGFGESSLDVELNCYILTNELNEFLAIREELLLRIMNVVADAGSGFAVPSRAIYMEQSAGHERPADNPPILRHGT